MYIYIERERERDTDVCIKGMIACILIIHKIMHNTYTNDIQQPYGGVYLVCDHGKHRYAKRHNCVCVCVTCWLFPPLPVPKVTPNIEPFSKHNLTT